MFLLDDQEITAAPGTYIHIAPGTLHGFRCDSEVGRVFNTLVPGGFDHGISEHGIPAPEPPCLHRRCPRCRYGANTIPSAPVPPGKEAPTRNGRSGQQTGDPTTTRSLPS